MSSERLQNIDAFFAREMERNRVPGAVVAIAHRGKLVYFKAFGFADKARGVPMATDTLFQLASMTKPMAAVGVLGRLAEVATAELPLLLQLHEPRPGLVRLRPENRGAAAHVPGGNAQRKALRGREGRRRERQE